MLSYLSANNVCSEKQAVFWEHSLRKIVSFEEQIISEQIFMPEAIIFFATHSFENWGISLPYSPVLAAGIFSHVTRLDQ